jgi:hypothetical protein
MLTVGCERAKIGDTPRRKIPTRWLRHGSPLVSPACDDFFFVVGFSIRTLDWHLHHGGFQGFEAISMNISWNWTPIKACYVSPRDRLWSADSRFYAILMWKLISWWCVSTFQSGLFQETCKMNSKPCFFWPPRESLNNDFSWDRS